ncbi:astacin-like metalloprotease toxin 5 [Stegodyphus dumicola]|uniref:astacin-like metalloprotease toxin 5 n=1 Tax=Stegodyphus dumicola TaxID=202533 RepID=UPI0015B2D063|nr:astacin-like metalloprotease toxin 5 [Stegodyphus dumicola]
MRLLLEIIMLSLFIRGFHLRNTVETTRLFQGDIPRLESIEKRNAVPKDSQRWPNGVIPYKIHKGLDHLKSEILKAMKYIMDNTCIKFVPWDRSQQSYLNIFSGDGCYSAWGRMGGMQELSLGSGCEQIAIILHELTHAIGFDHEQNRPDRDDYLHVFWHNILPSAVNQFDKLKPEESRLFNKIDFNSIMMYGERASSKDGYHRTLKVKNRRIRLTDLIKKTKLSESDIYRINALYECDKQRSDV